MVRARKDNRGGPRTGTVGKPYPNRADLRSVPMQAAPGQTYGAAKAQLDAQRAVPVAAPADPVAAALGHNLIVGGDPTATARPHEPVTAGLPVGAGPGPEVLPTLGGAQDTALATLRGLYMAYPTEDLRRIIQGMSA